MIITVDIDNSDWEIIRSTVLLGLEYGFKLLRISKSYSKKGYHVVFQTHIGKLHKINFYLDAPKELKDLVYERLRVAESLGIKDKVSVARIVLGDDPNRVLYDINKDYMPKQVLFVKYRWWK